MTEWGRNWIRLYKHPSPSWLALPHSARGLGYEMLRVCDEEGKIECKGGKPFDVVALACAIQGHGRRLAERDFERLKTDGFFRMEGSTIVIPNYNQAQTAQSPAAAKKAEQRRQAASKEAPASGTNPDPAGTKVPSAGTNSAPTGTDLVPAGTNSAHQTDNSAESLDQKGDSPPIRLDQTRTEENILLEERGTPTTTPTVPVVVPPPKRGLVVPEPSDLTEVLRRASKGKVESGIGQSMDEELSLKAFAAQRVKEGCDVLEEFRTLGEAIDAGVVQKQFPGSPSLLRWLGKPEADGTRPAKALVAVIGIANEWKRSEELKQKELDRVRNLAEQKKIQAQEQAAEPKPELTPSQLLAKALSERKPTMPVKAPPRPKGAGILWGTGVDSTHPLPVDSNGLSERN